MKIAILLLILSIVYNRYCSFYLCLGDLGHHLHIWNIGHLLQVSGYWIQYWDTIMFCNTDSGYHQYYMSRFGQKYLKSTRVILATPGTSVMHEMSFLSNTWWPLNHFISEKSPSPQWEMGMSWCSFTSSVVYCRVSRRLSSAPWFTWSKHVDPVLTRLARTKYKIYGNLFLGTLSWKKNGKKRGHCPLLATPPP